MITEDWIVGFADGEAWFTIVISPSKSSKIGFNLACVFRIQLAKQDLDILYRIKDFLGYGHIWIDKRGWGTYTISSQADASKLRDLFNKHPLHTMKQSTFLIWSQVLGLVIQKKHLTPEGLLEIALLRDSMNQNPKRASRRDYRNVDYFKERIKISLPQSSEIALNPRLPVAYLSQLPLSMP